MGVVELFALTGVLALSLAVALAGAASVLASVFYLISLPGRVHQRQVALDSGNAAAALLAGDLAPRTRGRLAA